MNEISFKEVILMLLKNGEIPLGQEVYFADGDAVWKVKKMVPTTRSTCGYGFICSVNSIFCNGDNGQCTEPSTAYRYGEETDFLLSENDKFFLNEGDAIDYRADLLVNLFKEASWK